MLTLAAIVTFGVVVVRLFAGVAMGVFTVLKWVVSVAQSIDSYVLIWVKVPFHVACYQLMRKIAAVRVRSKRFAFICLTSYYLL